MNDKVLNQDYPLSVETSDKQPQRNFIKIAIWFSIILLVSIISIKFGKDFFKEQEDTEESEVTKSEDQTNIDDQSDEAAETAQEEESCLKQYQNTYFSNISFQYDNCIWNVDEVIGQSNYTSNNDYPLNFEIRLTDTDNNLLRISVQTPILWGIGGPANCHDDEPVDLGSVYRVMRDGINYSYLPKHMLAIKGTSDYDEVIASLPPQILDTTINDSTTYCIKVVLGSTFESPYTAADLNLADKVSDPNSKVLTFLSFTYMPNNDDTESLLSADNIIKSFKY